MSGKKQPLIFSTRNYGYLRDSMAEAGRFELGKLEVSNFPDDERYLRLHCNVNNRNVVVVGGTISDSDTLELFDLCCGLAKYGAQTLRIAIPFYGYSTMERAVKAGEIVTAKTRARLLSAIPIASRGTTFFLLDLHSEGIPYYFEGAVTARHIYGKEVVMRAAKRLAGRRKDFVLASTDAGRFKWVESLASDMGVSAAFALKRRLSGDKTEIVGICGDVADKFVIIYDDMIRTGGSLIGAGKAYRKAGAKAIAVIATHGLFPGKSVERLKGCGCFTQIVTTDSHPRAVALQDDFLSVESVASVLARELKHGLRA